MIFNRDLLFSYIKPLEIIYNYISEKLTEPKESVYAKISTHSEYQEFEAWRSGLVRYLIIIEKHILKDIRPQLLHKILLLSQKNIYKQIKSPFFYHEYLQILKQNLPKSTPVVFTHILRDIRARLHQKILKQPKLALRFFHKDIVLQMIRLSGKKTNIARFKHMLRYYKNLVPIELYISVRNCVREFLKNYAQVENIQVDINEKPYIELQKKIDNIFEEYELSFIERTTKQVAGKIKSNPKATGLIMLAILLGGNYIFREKESRGGILHLFDLSIDPLLMNGLFHFFSQQHEFDVKFNAAPRIFPVLLSMSSFMFKSQGFMLNNKKANQPDTFFNIYNWTTGGSSLVSSMQVTHDDGFIMLGAAFNPDSTEVVKLSKSGDIEWKRAFPNQDFNGWTITQIKDGSYLAFGETLACNSPDSPLMMLNLGQYGNVTRSYIIEGPYVSREIWAQGTSDGNFVLLGFVSDENNYLQTLLIKGNAFGRIFWTKVIKVGFSTQCNFISVTDKGEFLIAGNILFENRADTDALVMKLDSNGNPIWAMSFGTSGYDTAVYLIQDSAKNYVISGGAEDTTFLVKIYENTTFNWAITIQQPYILYSMQETAEGNYIAFGDINTNSLNSKPLLYQWTPNGDLVWTKKFVLQNCQFDMMYKNINGGFSIRGNMYGDNNDRYNTFLVKLNDQAELIDCSLMQITSNPFYRNMDFLIVPQNISAYNVTYNSRYCLINKNLSSSLEVRGGCPKIDQGSSSDKGEQIGAYIIGGFVLVAVIAGTVLFLVFKRCFSANIINLDQFEHVKEFNYNQITLADNELGSGQYGKVYKGQILDLYAEVAVKILTLKDQQENNLKSDMMHELQLMRVMVHDNIIKLYGFSINHLKNEYCIVMEFAPNGSLAHALFPKDDGVVLLNWNDLYEIAKGIATGLNLLHSCNPQIIHEDLRSLNVLLGANNVPKICDFGLAHFIDKYKNNISSSEGGVLDTIYVAPEFRLHPKHVAKLKPNVKTDMYSYGAILSDFFKAQITVSRSTHKQLGEKTALLSVSKVDEFKAQFKLSRLMQSCMFYNEKEEADYSQRLRPSASEAIAYLEERISDAEFDNKFPINLSGVSIQV